MESLVIRGTSASQSLPQPGIIVKEEAKVYEPEVAWEGWSKTDLYMTRTLCTRSYRAGLLAQDLCKMKPDDTLAWMWEGVMNLAYELLVVNIF